MQALFEKPSLNLSQIIQTIFVVTVVPLVLQSGNNVVNHLFGYSCSWISHFWNYKTRKCSVRTIPANWDAFRLTTELYDAVEEYLNKIIHCDDDFRCIKNHHLIFPDVCFKANKLTFRPKPGTSFHFLVDAENNYKIHPIHTKEPIKNKLEIFMRLVTEENPNAPQKNTSSGGFNQNNAKPLEEKYYEVKLIGTNCPKTLDQFLNHVMKIYFQKRNESYRLVSISSNSGDYNNDIIWLEKTSTFDGVLMNDNLRKEIRDDIRLFWNDKDHYTKISQPHRCSFFLVGQPGSGKTSFIRCLPAETKIDDITVVALQFPSKSTNMMYDISKIFQKAKNISTTLGSGKAIWIIEDIDCVSSIVGKRDIDDADRQKHSAGLSAFLNAIDGIETPEHLMIVFTSNHPELIDPALVRPGRMDKIYNFDHVRDCLTLKQYGERFFSDLHTNLLPGDQFYQTLLDRKLTNASIVQIMKRFRNQCKIQQTQIDYLSIIDKFIHERSANNLDESIFVGLPN